MGKTYKGLDSLTDAYKDYLDEAIEDEKKEMEAKREFFESARKVAPEKKEPRKSFVEKVKIDEAKAEKNMDTANLLSFIRKRTMNFSYEYILSNLMMIKAQGKQIPKTSDFSSSVRAEGEGILSELRDKLSALNNRVKNINNLRMGQEELKEICGSSNFNDIEMKILKRVAVTELGPDKAGEVLGGNVVAEIVRENERYEAEQSK